MYKIKLSPYHKIFYNDWKLAPHDSSYNIVFDQSISNDLNIIQLQNALSRFIADYVLFDSHIEIINGDEYWVKNSNVSQLECFLSRVNSNQQIQDYVNKPFE